MFLTLLAKRVLIALQYIHGIGQKNAADVLARKIRRGGTGVWGVDVMPPQPQVSATEARALATYVLSLK